MALGKPVGLGRPLNAAQRRVWRRLAREHADWIGERERGAAALYAEVEVEYVNASDPDEPDPVLRMKLRAELIRLESLFARLARQRSVARNKGPLSAKRHNGNGQSH